MRRARAARRERRGARGGSRARPPGKFRDKMRAAEEERASLNESIMLRQSAEAQSHSAGFEAWLRSRGDIKARAVTPP